MLGVRVEEFQPLPPGEAVRLSTGDTGTMWRELVRAEGATVEARYPDGTPAITRHRTAWYVSTRLDGPALRRFLGTVLDAPPGTPGVEVVRRRGAGTSWLFVINHTGAAATVAARGVDVVSGEPVHGTLTVPAGGYAVVRE